jgi:hypothetical protein
MSSSRRVLAVDQGKGDAGLKPDSDYISRLGRFIAGWLEPGPSDQASR